LWPSPAVLDLMIQQAHAPQDPNIAPIAGAFLPDASRSIKCAWTFTTVFEAWRAHACLSPAKHEPCMLAAFSRGWLPGAASSSLGQCPPEEERHVMHQSTHSGQQRQQQQHWSQHIPDSSLLTGFQGRTVQVSPRMISLWEKVGLSASPLPACPRPSDIPDAGWPRARGRHQACAVRGRVP
jgi:hypothetical protein